MSFISVEESRRIFSDLGLNITKQIGEGGFKVVFEAFDEQQNHLALKALHPDKTDLNRLRREARAMETVHSPFVPEILKWGLGETTELPYLLEEFIEGEPLSRVLSRGYVYEHQEGTAFLIRALEGLSACAKEKIIHRDIKPANIMVRPDGTPVIIDFGLSRHVTLSSLTSTHGPAPGLTPHYAPPELLDYDKGGFDDTTDLFSLGITAYQMLTGKHPFLTNAEFRLPYLELKDKMLNQVARPIHEVDPRIPPQLSRFIMKLIRRERFERYRDTAYALERLHRIASSG
jgi:serine/threonine protein kinase